MFLPNVLVKLHPHTVPRLLGIHRKDRSHQLANVKECFHQRLRRQRGGTTPQRGVCIFDPDSDLIDQQFPPYTFLHRQNAIFLFLIDYPDALVSELDEIIE